MNTTEIRTFLDGVFVGLENSSAKVNIENESDTETCSAKYAKERTDKRNAELIEGAAARFTSVETIANERENELKASWRIAQKPLATSGDTQKQIIAQNYDTRARELVSMVDEPTRVIEEIHSSIENPDYCTALIEWARLKWNEGPRSKLGIEFDRAVSIFQDAIGFSVLNAELEAIKGIRGTLAARRELSEVGIYHVTDEDLKQAAEMNLTPEAYLSVKAGRIKKQREREQIEQK